MRNAAGLVRAWILPGMLAVFSIPTNAQRQSSLSGMALVPGTPAALSLSVQQAELGGTDTQQFSFFGYSVAASGDTVVVGAPGFVDEMGDSQPGRVYVFVKPADGWVNMVQSAELSASDNGSNSDAEFGFSIAIANHTIVVGAPGVAKAYLFVEPTGGWRDMTETAVIEHQATFNDDAFGYAVASDGSADTLFVGAPAAAIRNSTTGAAYVFLKPRDGWVDTSSPNAVLTASDAGAGDGLGNYIATSVGTVVVAANSKPAGNYYGAAYVFVRPTSGWVTATQNAELTASTQLTNAQLGTSLSVHGSTIVAGAPGPATLPGSVYVYVEPSGGWANATETARVSAGNRYPDGFGASEVVTGNSLIVGASLATVGATIGQGAAYLFVKPASGWKSTSIFAAELTDKYGTQDDTFGYSLALVGNALVSGAPFSFNQSDVGAAYILF